MGRQLDFSISVFIRCLFNIMDCQVKKHNIETKSIFIDNKEYKLNKSQKKDLLSLYKQKKNSRVEEFMFMIHV